MEQPEEKINKYIDKDLRQVILSGKNNPTFWSGLHETKDTK